MKRFFFVVTFGLISLTVFSQEYIVPVMDNPVLRNNNTRTKLKKASIQHDTLAVPFFDDFSGSLSVFPKKGLWQDSYVFINDSYGVDAMSIGVATFDALDASGIIYKHASEFSFGADSLTSKPINLNYPSTSNTYLSFYYQPQGLGDVPEAEDSLFVDFFNPATRRWWNVWKTAGTELHPFKAAIIPIMADSFLVRGFQFRFRNMASISGNEFDEGKMGNVDHWNIDYVKLDTNRTAIDTVMRDVAFSKPIKSLIKNYQAMPWKQFQIASHRVMRSDIDIYYRNNDTLSNGRKPERYFSIRDLLGTNVTSFHAGNENIDPQEEYHFTTNLEYPFFTDETDSAKFEVKSYLENVSYDIKMNDTTRFLQIFSDYFAYDDGVPEAGYGVSGQGTTNARVAYGFTSYMADSLTALRIFFNSTLNDINLGSPFKLTVWKALSNGPGDIIYQSETTIKNLGGYTLYKLDSALIVNGDFYVGWEQPSERFLNVGLDKNNSTPGKLYYNIGAWYKSAFDNYALMIRPVFGTQGLVSDTKEIAHGKFKLYPNPTSGNLNIEYPQEINGTLWATITNSTGKTVLQQDASSGTINLSDLPTGLYFIILTENGKKPLYKGKVLVQH